MTRREILLSLTAISAKANGNEIAIRPREYPDALRNPLMGFRPDYTRARAHAWATLARCYIKWNEIENSTADDIGKIREFSDEKWSGLAEANIKLIPRLHLEWPKRGTYWPSDMTTGDYSSPQFKQRVVGLIQKMGRAWDNDPRVAFIEMGLIGYWGEHHHPRVDLEMQELLGDAFLANFKNKLIMIRYPSDFQKYPFGIYWDSFGHPEEAVKLIPAVEAPPLAGRWKIAPMGGETAFDWGTPLGKNPTDAVINNCERIVGLIRRLHWNHLGWLSDYDAGDPQAARNAALIQKAFGYRFILDEVRYPATVEPGKRFEIAFSVRNAGCTPLYYNWPVEASFLDKTTREPVWRKTLDSMDVRKWLPVEGQAYTVRHTFDGPRLPRGEYVLALAILDPAGDLPSTRFAIVNYWRGGRHPLGLIGVGAKPRAAEITTFDDPAEDRSLHYTA